MTYEQTVMRRTLAARIKALNTAFDTHLGNTGGARSSCPECAQFQGQIHSLEFVRAVCLAGAKRAAETYPITGY